MKVAVLIALLSIATPIAAAAQQKPDRVAEAYAQFMLGHHLDETDDETLDKFLDIMLVAPFRLCREVIPHLGEGASVVNITSTFAHIGGRRGGAYSAAKGGLKSLTEHMACEYGPRGIRSNCVAPGVTRTEMVAHRFEDET